MSIASNNAFMFLLHVFKQYSNNPLAVSWTACRESFKAVGLDWCSTYHCNTTTASFLTFQPRWHLCLESRPLSLYLSRFVFYKGSVLERVCIFTTLYRTGRMHTSWITQLITCRLFVWMAWTGYNCAQGSHPGLHNLCRSASVTQDYTVCAGQLQSPRTTQSAQVSVSKNCHVTLLRRPRHDYLFSQNRYPNCPMIFTDVPPHFAAMVLTFASETVCSRGGGPCHWNKTFWVL